MTLLANAIQHPVGQGLFYSCRIHCRAHPEPIDFVCDCGTDSKREYLESAVEEYHRSISRRGLDFLILSHFDADHVNGLDLLLDGSFSTGTVFLPYLTPLQRMFLGIRNSSEADSYYDFLANPVGFLGGRGVQRVVFVTGGGPEDAEPEPTIDNRPPPDEGRNDFRLKYRGGKAPEDPSLSTNGTSVTVETLTDKCKVHAGYCWQIKFFNYETFPPEAFSIVTKVDAAPVDGDSPALARWKQFIRGLLDALAANTLNPAEILEGLKSVATRKKLKSAYRVISKDHNNVSLTTWHGPAYRGDRETEYRWHDEFRHGPRSWNSWGHALSFGGTLLTGDLDLGHDFQRFRQHYAGLLERTGFLGVPHHGSRWSWDARILPEIEERAFCFISAGFSSRHGHPNLDVVSDIAATHPWVQGHERCEVILRIHH